VRALRRPPLAFRQPSGLLASAARRPSRDGAIPCLCVGSVHGVGAWVRVCASTRCTCGAVLVRHQAHEQQPMDARGVTERTADDGRARASQARRTPANKSAHQRDRYGLQG
jgi:hypothetical protein